MPPYMLDLTDPGKIVAFVVSVLFCALICLYLTYLARHFSLLVASIVGVATFVAFTSAYLFQLWPLLVVIIAWLISASIVIILSIFTKSSLQLIFNFKRSAKNRRRIARVFNKNEVFEEITTAVKFLSKKKIGALITFERQMSLDEFLINGVSIDAPVSHQLLQTIFYPGTALHDGAVIIRNNVIISASVYFSPTTRPMKGKLGSRHRAAIGISEVCDAITVVVSEETGRISITANGEMEEIHPDNLFRALEDYLS